MNATTFSDGKTTYRRITKQAAFKRFCNDESFVLCPVKLRPGFPFAPHLNILPDRIRVYKECGSNEAGFRSIVTYFEYANCQMNETGYYTAFYVQGEK